MGGVVPRLGSVRSHLTLYFTRSHPLSPLQACELNTCSIALLTLFVSSPRVESKSLALVGGVHLQTAKAFSGIAIQLQSKNSPNFSHPIVGPLQSPCPNQKDMFEDRTQSFSSLRSKSARNYLIGGAKRYEELHRIESVMK